MLWKIDMCTYICNTTICIWEWVIVIGLLDDGVGIAKQSHALVVFMIMSKKGGLIRAQFHMLSQQEGCAAQKMMCMPKAAKSLLARLTNLRKYKPTFRLYRHFWTTLTRSFN